jgi:hypothetical protein
MLQQEEDILDDPFGTQNGQLSLQLPGALILHLSQPVDHDGSKQSSKWSRQTIDKELG